MICIQCSGVHRSLGTHISKVRSLQLDKWSKPLIQLLLRVGNKRANDVWEARLLATTGFSSSSSSSAASSPSPKVGGKGDFVLVKSPSAGVDSFETDYQSYTIMQKLALLKSNKGNFSNDELREGFIKRKYVEKAFVLQASPQMSIFDATLRINEFSLLTGAKGGDLLTVYESLVHGMQVDHMTWSDSAHQTSDIANNTPLMLACRGHHVVVMELLVQWNANLEVKDREGRTVWQILEEDQQHHSTPNKQREEMMSVLASVSIKH
jgi:hypothetical protein